MAFSYTPYKRPYLVGEGTVATDPSGDGTVAILFTPDTFVAAPQVMVVKANGEAGTFAATSITTTGFDLDVTSSSRVSQNIKVSWYAAEKI